MGPFRGWYAYIIAFEMEQSSSHINTLYFGLHK